MESKLPFGKKNYQLMIIGVRHNCCGIHYYVIG